MPHPRFIVVFLVFGSICRALFPLFAEEPFQKPSFAMHQKPYVSGLPFENITLEMSLKPFRENDPEAIRAVCRELFTQWASLLRHTRQVSVMLWTADGSEILDYSGDLNQPLEWGKYIGNPNTGREVDSGPAELSHHERAYNYMDDPPKFTFGDLKRIARTLKEEGEKMTGKTVRVGETFDPGPEFAKSDFKYKKHPEICLGGSMGKKSMVTCYTVLHRDDGKYAAYPDGIPEGTPFGTFFGKQSQRFLSDLGFDYLWFSNGFGFGMETWHANGAIFDGKMFHRDKVFDTRKVLLEFWKLFRKECPHFPIETRGTNQTTGADMAADGVDLRGIYRGGFNILPPPNSPWAALNGDFGFELAGYMSRIAELPAEEYMFRYYTHDPWWLNSPWLDRYGREPHDIYLPMAVARIDAAGKIALPTHLNLLTADDSLGNMPKQVPDEVTPHILAARYDAPDAPGPLVWAYPFDEYHDWADTQPERLEEIFFGDWFIRQAINETFPLNTVVSTANFVKTWKENPRLYAGSVLVTVVPTPGSPNESALIDFVEQGGKLLVYGPILHASDRFRRFLNLRAAEPLSGELEIALAIPSDRLLFKSNPTKIRHNPLLSGGGIESLLAEKDAATRVLATMRQGETSRDVALVRSLPEWKGGKVVYVRGTNSTRYPGGHLLIRDNPNEYFTGGLLMRYALAEFGIVFRMEKQSPDVQNPVITVNRHDNGFYFSGFAANTTVKNTFRFPQGAPLLTGLETILEEHASTYFMPKAWHRECRIFVEQANPSGLLRCKECTTQQIGVVRRLEVGGLENATVFVYPAAGTTEKEFKAYLNAAAPWKKGRIPFEKGPDTYGNCFVIRNVSGVLTVAW